MTRPVYDPFAQFNPRKPTYEGPYRNQRERRVLNQPKPSRKEVK